MALRKIVDRKISSVNTSPSSKLYDPNWLSLTSDNPDAHRPILGDTRPKYTKQVVELRKIDKILHGVIKQRMFGTIQLQGYTRTKPRQLSTIETPNSRVSHLSRESSQQQQTHDVHDVGRRSHNSTFRITQTQGINICSSMLRFRRLRRNLDQTIPNSRDVSLQKQEMPLKRQLTNQHPTESPGVKSAKPSYRKPPQILNLKEVPGFQQYFREAAKISTGHGTVSPTNNLLNDTRLSKQQIKQLFRNTVPMSESIVERFFIFFDVPNSMHYKQYIQTIENIANLTTLKQIHFVCFQFMDRNKDGLIGIDDLFKFLEENNAVPQIEKEVFMIHEVIKNLDNSHQEVGEPETDQILVRNHGLKLEMYRELLKHPSKEIVSCKAKKSTVYHLCIQALEHYDHIRLKKDQLEKNKSIAVDFGDSQHKRGLRLPQFEELYESVRPGIFLHIMKVLTSKKLDSRQPNY